MSDPLQYRLLEVLGSGPLGTVYLAERSGGNTPVERIALKLLDGPRANPAALGRLEAAMPALSWVKHPVVVRSQALVRFEERAGILSAVVEGCDIRRLLRQGQVPAGPAMEIMAAAAGGLAAALSQQGPDGEALWRMHGDLRPTNVMLTRFGEVRLTDLGIIPALTGGDADEARRIEPDVRLAPEAAAGTLTPSGDVYALGLILFELLAGRPFPRAGTDAAGHKAVLSQAVHQLMDGGIDPMAVMLAESLLSFDPASRPAPKDVERLARDLRRSVSGPSLREWAAEVVPTMMDSGGSRRDTLVGMVIRGIETRPAPPAAGVGLRAVPAPTPLRSSRASMLSEEDDVTVTVTAPHRAIPNLAPLPELAEHTAETEFDYDPTEVTEAKISSSPKVANIGPGAAPPAEDPPTVRSRAITFSARIVERPTEPELPRPEPPRAELPRPEPPRAELPRPEPPRAEPPRTEPPRPEAPEPARPERSFAPDRPFTPAPERPGDPSTSPRPAGVEPLPSSVPTFSSPGVSIVSPNRSARASLPTRAPARTEPPEDTFSGIDSLPAASVAPLPDNARPALVVRSTAGDSAAPPAAAPPVGSTTGPRPRGEPTTTGPRPRTIPAGIPRAPFTPTISRPPEPPPGEVDTRPVVPGLSGPAVTEPLPPAVPVAPPPVAPAPPPAPVAAPSEPARAEIPPAAPMSMLTDETDAPPAEYPSSNRANIIMWLPTGCFLLAMLSLGLVYLYLYLR